jgi:hypothetical protein
MRTPTLSTSHGCSTASCCGTRTRATSATCSGSPARFSHMSARALQDHAIRKAPAGSDRTIGTDVEAQPRAPRRSLPCRPVSDSRRTPRPHLLDPNRLPDHDSDLRDRCCRHPTMRRRRVPAATSSRPASSRSRSGPALLTRRASRSSGPLSRIARSAGHAAERTHSESTIALVATSKAETA